MAPRRLLPFSHALLALAVTAPIALAQPATGTVSDRCLDGANENSAHMTFGARHPDSVFARWRPDSARAEWIALGARLREHWDEVGASVPPAVRAAMQIRLDSLRDELRLAEEDLRASEEAGGPRARRFSLVVRQRDDDETYQLFVGPSGAGAEVSDSDPDDVRLALCGTARLAQHIATIAGDTARAIALQRLERRDALWRRYEDVALSMTPLELVVNSWCRVCRPDASLMPPRWQIVLGHLSPGFEIANLRDRGSTGRAALVSEFGGLLWYAPSREWYLGASFIASYPSEAPSSLGVMLRVSKLGQAGVLWPPDAPSGRLSLVVSTDLYRFIARGSPDTRKELLDQLERCRVVATTCVR